MNVESVDGSLARCSVQTGVQDPLALQYDGRTEYLGLVTTTRPATSTELLIHTGGSGDKPLEDLEVFARNGKETAAVGQPHRCARARWPRGVCAGDRGWKPCSCGRGAICWPACRSCPAWNRR